MSSAPNTNPYTPPTAYDAIGNSVKPGDIVAYKDKNAWWTGEIVKMEPARYGGYRVYVTNKVYTSNWRKGMKHKDVWVEYNSFVKVDKHASITW